MLKKELALGRLHYPAAEHPARPTTRADCEAAERPCPFVSCKHHLYLDVRPTNGSLKLNFPDLEVGEMADSCVLDVAARGGANLEEVGALLNLTRARIQQIEAGALAKVLAHRSPSLRDFANEGPFGKRRLPLLAVGSR
jgi:hypothetical protein